MATILDLPVCDPNLKLHHCSVSICCSEVCTCENSLGSAVVLGCLSLGSVIVTQLLSLHLLHHPRKHPSSRESISTISTLYRLKPPAIHLKPSQPKQHNPPPTPSATSIPQRRSSTLRTLLSLRPGRRWKLSLSSRKKNRSTATPRKKKESKIGSSMTTEPVQCLKKGERGFT